LEDAKKEIDKRVSELEASVAQKTSDIDNIYMDMEGVYQSNEESIA
jgi:hypothetical protein